MEVWKIFTIFISFWIRLNNYFLHYLIFEWVDSQFTSSYWHLYLNWRANEKSYCIICPKEMNFWFSHHFFVVSIAVLCLVFFSNGCIFHQNMKIMIKVFKLILNINVVEISTSYRIVLWNRTKSYMIWCEHGINSLWYPVPKISGEVNNVNIISNWICM